VAAAVALFYGFDRRAEVERFPAIEAADKLVKRLRRQGVSEDEAKHFLAKYGGRRWEEFFEAVFGFEAKMAVRATLMRGGTAGSREQYAAWRDRLRKHDDVIDLDAQDLDDTGEDWSPEALFRSSTIADD
jgi:hypothetical protein